MTKSVLIVGPSWVGDMVMSQSLYRELKRLDPETDIDVLAPAWSRPILNAMPEVRRSIDMPLGHGQFDWAARKTLGKALRSESYDRSIVLPNSWKSALIPWFSKIPVRTGWRGEVRYGLLNDMRVLDKQAFPYMVQRYVALAAANPSQSPTALDDVLKPALSVDDTARTTLQAKWSLAADKRILGLCPGAEFGPAKRWPQAHYASVARQHIEQGGRVVLFGSVKDRAVAESIIALVGSGAEYCTNLAGETTLAEALAGLSLCESVVSNDSGLMHVAAALGRPLVAVYGSSSAHYTPPLADQVRSVSLSVDCGPCFQKECPLGHMKCLTQLAPEQVLKALGELDNQ